MTLLELSVQYANQADVLRERILRLQVLWAKSRNQALREALSQRVKILTAMRREARDLAVLCARYYERGYRRNERYSL